MSRRRLSRSRPLAVAAVALLLVTAGCSAISGQGGGTRADAVETPTLTPVPVVTDEGTAAAATPTPDTLIEGLGPAGVRDPFTLATNHRRQLTDGSFRRVRTERIEGPDGTIWNETTSVRVSADRSRLLFEKDVERAPSYPVDVYRKNLSIYYDGNASYFRGVVDGELSYARVAGSSGSVLSDVSERDWLMVLFERFQWEAETVESGYRMRSEYLLDDTVLNAPPLVDDPENATMTVWLTHGGRVRSYRLSYSGTLDGQPVRITRTARFVGVGATTVPEPDWYPEAANATDG